MRKLMMGAVALGVMTAAVPAGADVKAGVDAWARGDFTTAIAEWRPLAVAGDPDAQFNLGQAYKLGRGVPLDPALAESWFRKAAVQGHAQAEDNYGLALFQAGKKGDAAPWLEKSVARGEPRTQLVLGTMLFNGDGVPRDYPRAYALMTRASAAGLQSASQTLAQMDEYISPADREKGTALAQQYAAQAKAPAVARVGTVTNAPPATTTAARPQRLPMQSGPERIPASAIGKPAEKSVAKVPTPAKPMPPKASAPTPAPAAVPARSAAAPARTGGWRIQLGAFKDEANARTLWNRVRGRVGGAQPSYPKAGGVTRLQAGGFASKAAAQRACTASGTPCVVVAP